MTHSDTYVYNCKLVFRFILIRAPPRKADKLQGVPENMRHACNPVNVFSPCTLITQKELPGRIGGGGSRETEIRTIIR